MSSELVIRDDARWIPATWVYRNWLEHVTNDLQTRDPPLAATLGEHPPYAGSSYDVQALAIASFRALLAATQQVYNHFAEAGPASFQDRTFYPGFLDRLSELKMLLRTDPRGDQPVPAHGRLQTRAATEWIAPAWLFDLVLEQLASTTLLAEPLMGAQLLRARVEANGGFCDLQALNSSQFRLLQQPVEKMHHRFVIQGPGSIYAPTLLAHLTPYLHELKRLFAAAARSA